VAQKQTASIQIKTAPNAQCAIEVTLPSGTISTSKDLSPKTADADGKVTWSWSISWNTKPSPPDAVIKLSCKLGDDTVSGQLAMTILTSSPTPTP